MWSHALNVIRCPWCQSSVRLSVFETQKPLVPGISLRRAEQHGIQIGDWVSEGALACDRCKVVYPITRGLPLLLVYPTRASRQAIRGWKQAQHEVNKEGFGLPNGRPPSGEEYVAASFSREWMPYEYGETLWTASTSDRLLTFQQECGLADEALLGKRFAEIGCGLGIMTNEASTRFGAEAWGIDLSAAAFKAADHFMTNPMVHFVQASVLALPFAAGQFDFLYSHGVLFLAWSTKEAIERAANLVAAGGTAYVWLYGYKDVHRTPARKVAFLLESAFRPLVARLPGWLATAALTPLVPLYIFASYLGKRSGTHTVTYTWGQALHAARDRFSPLYAHRHDELEVKSWLKDLGFMQFHTVKGAEVPASWAVAMDNNVAIRASEKTSSKIATLSAGGL